MDTNDENTHGNKRNLPSPWALMNSFAEAGAVESKSKRQRLNPSEPALLLTQLASIASSNINSPPKSDGLDVLLSGIDSLNNSERKKPFTVQMLLNPKPERIERSPSSSSSNSACESPEMEISSEECSVSPPDSLSRTLEPFYVAANETVVRMFHACVAQKSYGCEKRFLCPPPVVQLAGSLLEIQKPMLRMGIVLEEGSHLVDYKSGLDEQGRSLFKYLHVTDTLKSKRFHLKLRTSPSHEAVQSLVFDSKPITIISKPSKKTSKARNNTLAILSGSMVCLFNRVNSQTVRTKYLTVESKRLCAKNSSWTAFEILAINRDKTVDSSGGAISYGASVILRNVETGLYSDILIVRKVAKDVMVHDAQGAVSQMQKVALESAAHPGLFLSIVPQLGGFGSCGTNPFLCYQRADQSLVEVDNHMSWTIVGVEKTQYRFNSQESASNMRVRTSTRITNVSAEVSLEFHGENLHLVSSVNIGEFCMPSVVGAAPNVVTCNLPVFENEEEFVALAERTSFGYCCSLPVILNRQDDGSVYHTGYFVVYEQLDGGRITRRLIEL